MFERKFANSDESALF